MGNQQPKKITRATKAQIEIACLKSRIHLELMRDRKNAEIIKGEKQLVAKIKATNRNKTEESLLIQRITNGLRYTQACHFLIGYAAMLKPQAEFIHKNMMFPDKMEPFLTPIYTLIYAAQVMGLSSLQEFRALMKALNDPATVGKYVNQEVMQLLSPKPTPQDLNTYVIQMAERNNLTLEQINIIGHKFSRDLNPIGDSFTDLQRQLAENMKKEEQQNPYKGPGGNNGGGGYYGGYGGPGGFGGQGSQGGYDGQGNNGGYGAQGGYGGQGGFGGTGGLGGQGGYGPGGKSQGGYYDQPSNPNSYQGSGSIGGTGNFGGSFGPGNNNPTNAPDFSKHLPELPTQFSSHGSGTSSNPYGIRDSYNPDQPKQDIDDFKGTKDNAYNDSRVSVNSINDLEFFPEIDPVMKPDPKFDQICEILRAAM